MKTPGITPRILPLDPTGARKPANEAGKAGGPSFADSMKELFYSVNDKAKVADTKVTQVITGENDDLHNAMIALEEANISFQLMLEVRNKMLEAYQEINRMNI
ncbi:MAG: flagellar hook-basal body complex protein FliE [Candidatus Marinimicrobia bacterium]|nr:flagellar hook-basal body complex protein FliE [Candidatus Neomarinimicrobiota bacterium]